MKESYISKKVGKLLSFGGKKKIQDLDRAHQIGRVVNRMNAIISETSRQTESYYIESFKQICKEELK